MIAITGANGFIGKNLFLSFLKEEKEMILVDYSFDSIENNEKHLLLNPEDFLINIETDTISPSFVFHQGACTDTMCYDEAYMIRENYIYTVRLIDLCVKKNIPIVYASSAAVYGDGPFQEEAVKNPKNIYAKSKSLVDDYIEDLISTTETQITGLRYFNVYGPREERKGKMSSVINQFKEQILSNKEIKIFEKSEEYKRDFIYVDDVVSVNRHFYNENISGIFNCGTGQAQSFSEVPKILKNHFEFDIKEIKMPSHLQGKYQEYTESDNRKLVEVGKYNKKFLSLQEGIGKNVEYWYTNGLC